MAEETTSGADVKTQEPITAGDAVKTQPDIKTAGETVKTQTVAEPTVKTVNFNGFDIPEAVYNTIRDFNYKKGAENALVELKKEGLVIEPSEKDIIKTAALLTESFGETVSSDGKKPTAEAVLDFMNKERARASEAERKKREAVEKQLTKTQTEHQTYLSKVRESKREEAIRTALLDNEEIDNDMINDAVQLIKLTNAITINQDDNETAVVINPGTGDKLFNTDGEPVSLKDFCGEWLQTKPKFQKTVGKDGAGGSYRVNGKDKKLDFGPPHLRNESNAAKGYTKGESRHTGKNR